MNLTLTLILLIPFLAAFLIAILPSGNRLPFRIALTASTAVLLWVGFLVATFPGASTDGEGLDETVENARTLESDGFHHRMDLDFGNPAGIRYSVGVDGMSLTLLALTALVTMAAVGISSKVTDRPREFFINLMLIAGGAIGAFISLDLFFLYVFHEVALIPTFLLIGLWGSHSNREKVAMRLTLYLSLGSLVLLAGLLILAFGTGSHQPTFDILQLRGLVSESVASGQINGALAFGLIFCGFGILIGLFPFYSWAPQGYAGAPAAASMMHAGVLKKFGLYGLLRLSEIALPGYAQHFSTVIGVLLVLNILYVGYVAMAEGNLKLMLGYSSVAHMGYLFLGFLASNQLGYTGAVLYMFAHGLSAALGFAIANHIEQETGTGEMKQMGGLARTMPFTAVIFTIVAMASVGLPGLANFPGELMIFFGAWEAQHEVYTVLALWGVVISSVYMLRAVRNIFHGEMPARFAHCRDLASPMDRWPYLLLTGALFLVGLCPQIITTMVAPSVAYWLKLSGH